MLPCAINSAVYETGTSTQVTAFHVMPGMPPPEGERHSHDYRFEVVVQREELDERGMVVDLDVLDAALRSAADAVEDRDLEDVVAEVVTVEVFARWLHDRLAAALSPGVHLGVRVWENPVAYGGYAAPL
jgi:6-pyruvoyltetrahydropterin/6-carboxytetrahydropterin synthase